MTSDDDQVNKGLGVGFPGLSRAVRLPVSIVFLNGFLINSRKPSSSSHFM